MFYQWAWQHPVSDAADQINIDRQTAIDIYQWLREVCSQSLIQTRIVLGGPGTVVHVDESLFRHKPKVSFVFAIIFKFKDEPTKKRNLLQNKNKNLSNL